MKESIWGVFFFCLFWQNSIQMLNFTQLLNKWDGQVSYNRKHL